MKIRSFLKEKELYRVLNTALLLGIGLFGAGRYLGIVSPGFLHVVAALSVLLLSAGFHALSARGRILYLLGIAGGLGTVCLAAGLVPVRHFLTSYIRWLRNTFPWKEEWIQGYELLQVFWLAVVCYLLQMVMEKNFRMKGAIALGFLGGLIYCFFGKRMPDHRAVVFCIGYLAMVAAEETQRHWKKEKMRDTRTYMLWISPFLAAYILILLLLPKPQKPYDWQIFKDIYSQLKDSFLMISQNVMQGDREDYGSAFSGFSEDGNLKSGIREDDKEVMILEESKGLVTNVYLMGKVFDQFDGRKWEQSENCEKLQEERSLDTIETLYAVQRYQKESAQDYILRAQVKIRYLYFHSGYVFAPLKTWDIEKNQENILFEDQGGSLFFGKKQGYGTEYEVSFDQINADHPAFYEFLETKTKQDKELLEKILSDFEKATGRKLTEEDLQRNRQMIYENYLEEIPLSRETRAYLEKITKGADTDVEKLKAIETELASFAYNLNPGELPATVTDAGSFLEYFLLDSREGYCSYFATAFVLLARAEGIPARYVQGFCVPANSRDSVVVTSGMAHAWPEVYLEDIGWVPFEPTPGYAAVRYTPWKLRQEKSDRNAVSSVETDAAEEPVQGAGEEVPDASAEESAGTAIGKDLLSNVVRLIRIVVLIGVIVLAAALLVLGLERLIGRWRYRRMNEVQQYMVEISRTFKLLLALGISRRQEETLEEFQKRISAEPDLKEDVQFIEDYEKFLYGNLCVNRQIIQQVIEKRKKLLLLMRQKKRWRYIRYCIFQS